jgi:integrase/recombinase XerC
MQVVQDGCSHRIVGPGDDVFLANRYLDHLATRAFAAATVRTYAFHLLSFLRFCAERELNASSVAPTDLFDFLD